MSTEHPPPIAILANDKADYYIFSDYLFQALPDTTIQYQEGDTVDTYTTGGDSVYVLYEDTLADTAMAMGWYIPTETEHMIIELTEHHLPIEQGLLGVNVSDMFEPGHANADELAAKYGTEPDPWDYLSEMQPKVLRFPSGAGGKFYQPLGSLRTNPDDPDVGMLNGGYGINIDEVIRFYDVTDNGVFNAPPLYDVIGDPMITSIQEDMTDGNCLTCLTWMATGQISTFEDNYNKWASQPIINPALLPEDMGNDLYINQFIDLVQQIESENGYTVDVLVCLNILNQTATEAVKIIQYLQDNGIQIAGVEIGNEVYFEWAGLMLGFKDTEPVSTVNPFIRYWDYINGHEYDTGTSGEDPGDGTYLAGDFDLSAVLPADVLADHDYLGALNAFDPDLEIGLPAANFDPCDTWDTPFIIDDPDADMTFIPGGPGEPCVCDYPQWNLDMETKFDHTIAGGEGGGSAIFKFDAIILHNYYVAGNAHAGCPENTNWQVAAAEPTFVGGAPYGTPWTYPGFDENLGELFEGIAGIPTDPAGTGPAEQLGNMKVFVRDRIKNAFDIHAENLHFYDTDVEATKQVWFSEYNLLPKTNGETEDADEPFVFMVPNTFVHAVALQNWILWNIKAYFDPDYKPGIFTLGTVQAFLGGNPIDMMTPASRNDQVMLELPEAGIQCTTDVPIPAVEDYYVRRTTYYTMQLLNAIHVYDLQYEKTFVGLYMLNNNLPPTSFVELNASGVPINIYVYYTNIKQSTQKYVMDPGDLYLSIPGALGVTLEPATIYALNPAQLSSTSGNNAMYTHVDITEAYGCTPNPLPINAPHPFEIISTGTSVSGTSCPGGFTPPPGGICVTVPATSAGYFVIPIEPALRLGNTIDLFAVYPNPASSYFVVQLQSDAFAYQDALTVELYGLYGNLIHKIQTQIGQPVDISMLPVGPYTVVIRAEGYAKETKTLIKMH